jgi:aminopeptidase YwaD
MTPHPLNEKVANYLSFLCKEIPTRRVGSQGNRDATEFLANTLAAFGFQVEQPEFACLDWVSEGARLQAGGNSFDITISPYSTGCIVRGPLTVVSNLKELEGINIEQNLLLVYGELAKEQLMPKNFTFYNPEQHKRIISLLESRNPQAIVCATSHNPELAGAVYPFPLIEDGDFDIPSVYMTEEEGKRLASLAGCDAFLEIYAYRIHAKGYNVIAWKGNCSNYRVVLTAHIDSKDGTPGALDNAAGVIVLLLLAELLRDYIGDMGIEIAIINGEDHYSAAGEVLYLKMNQGKLDSILININIDAVGFHLGDTAYSLYEASKELITLVHKTFFPYPGIVEGEPWYQGDHMVFYQNHVPALAITSDRVTNILSDVAHTPQDLPELVDPGRLVHVALALHELLVRMDIMKR